MKIYSTKEIHDLRNEGNKIWREINDNLKNKKLRAEITVKKEVDIAGYNLAIVEIKPHFLEKKRIKVTLVSNHQQITSGAEKMKIIVNNGILNPADGKVLGDYKEIYQLRIKILKEIRQIIQAISGMFEEVEEKAEKNDPEKVINLYEKK